ncbi:hypothetical protein [Planobispora rosea]|uniref:hypothetical protein n=1 Tax=Planobispora rosea TaxID=35762 RepID=UPI00167092C4|nr:hypothetical protein [Planobispora rosea]
METAVDGVPDPTLPNAVRTLLSTLAPQKLITTVNRLLQAGMPWMSEHGGERAQLLSLDMPRAGTIRTLPPALLDGGPAWRTYLAALGHPSQVSADEIIACLPDPPISVVDDLIDLALLDRTDEPWKFPGQEKERVYIRARVAPETISAEGAELIRWSDMQRRHAFLVGDELTGEDVYGLLASLWRGEQNLRLRPLLPAGKQAVLDEILLGAQTGRWPEHLTSDYGLWSLLSALWTPSAAVDAKLTEFHAWRAFYNCYRWILMGWLDKAKTQAEKLLEAAAAKDDRGEYLVDQTTYAEINNICAYLAQDTNELEFAIRLLEEVKDIEPSAARNLKIVRERSETTVNERQDWQNPYLAIGLPHGYEDWKDHYRSLLKDLRGDVKRLAAVNKAVKRLMDDKTSGTGFFLVPLDDETLSAPSERSPVLLPPIEPLPRRTSPATREELAALRDAAAHEILNHFREVTIEEDADHGR